MLWYNSLHIIPGCSNSNCIYIFQIGGATGLVGDPSGRNTERQIMSDSIIAKNLASIEQQICRLFKNHADIFWKKKKHTAELKDIRLI